MTEMPPVYGVLDDAEIDMGRCSVNAFRRKWMAEAGRETSPHEPTIA